MATLLSVVNVAREALGLPLEQVIQEGTTGGDLAARIPELAREQFENYPWNFASRREELARLPGKPIGYEFAYALPAGALRIVWISRTGSDLWNDRVRDYREEDGRLLCDYEPLFGLFTFAAYTEDYGRWPQVFAEALGLEAALRRNRHVTQGAGEGDRLMLKAEDAWRRAKLWDAQRVPWKPKPVGRFVVSRWQGLGGQFND